MKKKNLWILFSILAIIIGVEIYLLFIYQKEKQQETLYFSEYDSRISMGSDVYTNELPENTGATYDDSYVNGRVEFAKLADSAPIINEYFNIEYDSENDQITVQIYPPFDTNKSKFEAWLKNNGDGDIDQTSFVISGN